MAKEFYTERDIEDMYKRGVRSLEVGDDVVLTELAYEKANKLGLQLAKGQTAASPVAPAKMPAAQVVKAETPCACKSEPAKPGDLEARIRIAVNAKLGADIDPALLDVIIKRVLKSTGVK
jgi:hypothetical protein